MSRCWNPGLTLLLLCTPLWASAGHPPFGEEAPPARPASVDPVILQGIEERETTPAKTAPRVTTAPGTSGAAPSATPAKKASQVRRPPMTKEVAREISAEEYARAFAQHPPKPAVATGWAWVGHSVAVLIPAAGLVSATVAQTGPSPALHVGINVLSASVLGLVPARLGYTYGNPTRPRWREIDVAILGLSLVLTPPLAALGSFGSQSLFFESYQHPWQAYGAATAGALVGHLTGMIINEFLGSRLPMPELAGYRFVIGLSCVGIGATLGQTLFGGPLR